MSLLEIIGADLTARNMCRYCEDRDGAAMAIEQPVDEMKIAGTATPCADRELTFDVRIGTGGEGRYLLVADVDPFDGSLATHRVRDPIERIANYSVDSLDPCSGQGLYQNFRYCRHKLTPFPSVRLRPTDARSKGLRAFVH